MSLMVKVRRYRGVEIERTRTGWWVAFIPGHGFLKADDLPGIRELIRGVKSGGKGDVRRNSRGRFTRAR
jgi:hypothetical protein